MKGAFSTLCMALKRVHRTKGIKPGIILWRVIALGALAGRSLHSGLKAIVAASGLPKL